MVQENAGSSNLESVNAVYAQRVGNLESADDQVRDEQVAADDGFDHSDSPLVEEQRFVANPADLRKEVSSEEEFSAGLTDGEQDLGVPTDGDVIDVTDGDTGDEDEAADTAEELPKESWKRDDIVKYLVDHDAIKDEKDVEGQTKAQLIDNFVDSNG